MTDITIPPAALEAGREAFLECDVNPSYSFDDVLRAACLAMIEAWPGMSQLAENDSASIRELACLILPLTENSDE